MPLFVYLVFVIILLFEVPQIEIDIKFLYITKICSELKRDADTNILNTKIYIDTSDVRLSNFASVSVSVSVGTKRVECRFCFRFLLPLKLNVE